MTADRRPRRSSRRPRWGSPSTTRSTRAVREIGTVTVRTTRSQVAFSRRRGFAYLWIKGRWLRRPAAEVVLSIVLPAHDPSHRFKEVVHPSRTVWMHHLEVAGAADIDAEVVGWLRRAYEGAA